MTPGTRIAALDLGTRRIGVAVADQEIGVAFARPALRSHGADRDVAQVAQLLADERVTRVVVGLPLHMAGHEGEGASRSRAFGSALSERGVDVVYWDERLTTWQADGDLAAAGRRADRASGELDSAAARVILQDYLDAQRLAALSPEEAE